MQIVSPMENLSTFFYILATNISHHQPPQFVIWASSSFYYPFSRDFQLEFHIVSTEAFYISLRTEEINIYQPK